MPTLTLRNGQVVLFDEIDKPLVESRKWHQNKAGYVVTSVHVPATETKPKSAKKVFLHRLIAATAFALETDHRNGDRLVNTRENLRPATKSQNQGNQKVRTSGKTSKFKGVSWYRRRSRWHAQLRTSVDGHVKQCHLGYFEDEEGAARAYDMAARRYFGEFARTNFAQ